MEPDYLLQGMLMYLVVALWLATGFADYLCHRAAHIEHTSGWRESALHILQFAEMAVLVPSEISSAEDLGRGRQKNELSMAAICRYPTPVMMGSRGFNSGDDYEAFTRRTRCLLRWRPGALRAIKRRFWKRVRSAGREELRRGDN